jgi:hypothetical protein
MVFVQRKVMALAIVVLCAGLNCKAACAGTVIGVKVGLANSRLNMDGWGGSESYKGLTIGPFVSVPISSVIEIQPSVVYTRRGGEYNDQRSYPDGPLAEVDKATYSVDYIEIPLVIRYRLSSNRGWWPVLIAGPLWRTPVSSELTWDWDRVTDWADKSDFGFVVGFGTDARVGSLVGSIEVQFSSSFSAIGGSEDYTFDATLEGLNVQFSLGY